MKLPTLDDVDIDGKTVLARVDINSPLHPDTLDILDIARIKRILPTLNELRDGKIVLLAHQGRPGSWDFTGMEKHAHTLSYELKKKVIYIDDLYGKKAQKAIKQLKNGEILLLDNVRKYKGEIENKTSEEHASSPLVKNLAPLADIFVNDAFAAAHRSHCSLVGFPYVLPSYAGRLLETELKILTTIMEHPQRPCIFILGGAKYATAITVIAHLLETGIADKILLGGIPGNAFLKVTGAEIKLEIAQEEAKSIKKILKKFADKIVLPLDCVVDNNGVKEKNISQLTINDKIGDIGSATINLFIKEIRDASTLVLSGPLGIFEKKGFEKGTKEIINALATTNSFSVIGGGHTNAVANALGVIEKLSYASTGGGSLEQLLMGCTLPAIEALVGKNK
jgi:phosphoglycerate kinase